MPLNIFRFFYKNLLRKIYHDFNKELFTVVWYWHGDVYHLEKYLKEVNFEMSLFDVPLHYHFYDASHANERCDFSHILIKQLVSITPSNAVTFVDNRAGTKSIISLKFSDWFKGHVYC